MMPQTGIVRLFTSSKSLAVLGALVLFFTLMVLHIDPEPFGNYAWKLVTAYVLGASVEDAAGKLAQRPRTPGPTATATVYPGPPSIAPNPAEVARAVPPAPLMPSDWESRP